MRISDWSSDVCSSDLPYRPAGAYAGRGRHSGDRLRLPAGRALQPADSPYARALSPPAEQPGAPDPDLRQLRARAVARQAGPDLTGGHHAVLGRRRGAARSEEPTSELQSLMRISYA